MADAAAKRWGVSSDTCPPVQCAGRTNVGPNVTISLGLGGSLYSLRAQRPWKVQPMDRFSISDLCAVCHGRLVGQCSTADRVRARRSLPPGEIVQLQFVVVPLGKVVRVVLDELVLHTVFVEEVDAPAVGVRFRDEAFPVACFEHPAAQ